MNSKNAKLYGVFVALAFLVSVILWNFKRAEETSIKGEIGMFPVDLSEHAQFKLTDYGSEEQWGIVPKGDQSFNGVNFHLEGYFEVKGVAPARHNMLPPMSVDQISLNRYGSHFHLIHGTGFTAREGDPVVALTFHYDNKETRTCILNYGEHMRNWWRDRVESRDDVTDPATQIIWTGISAEAKRYGADQQRLFHTILENPLPHQKLASLDVVSLLSDAKHIFVALTIENREGFPSKSKTDASVFLDQFNPLDFFHQVEVELLSRSSNATLTGGNYQVSLLDEQGLYQLAAEEFGATDQLIIYYPKRRIISMDLMVFASGFASAQVTLNAENTGRLPNRCQVVLESFAE